MNIKITVRNKLPICGDVAIVCNNSDYTVIWELDEEWDGYDTKTMRTVYKDGTYTDTVFTGDTVALPVVTVPGTVKIGLYAGDIRTSRAALIRAFPSITSDDGTPAAPSDDVYDQIMEQFNGIRSVPEGGKKGQVLTKLSDETGDAGWQTPTGGTGGGVQPDWNQNDETQPDYVKNRPCVVGEDGALAWNVPPVSDATILEALKEIDALPVVTDGGKILTANDKILLW